MNDNGNQQSDSSDKISLPPLNLPPADIRIMRDGNLMKIFDPLRDKYVNLSPEEYVRQHFVNFMTQYLHYPISIMANEVGINLNGLKRRCDTIVFRPDGMPLVIVEYKAPCVAISQKTFNQIARYNMRLMAKYLIVSNGLQHYCCVMDYDKDTYHFISKIPDYKDILSPFSDN